MNSALFAGLEASDPEFAVRAVDQLLTMAIDRQASDVHLQPRKNGWDVLMRFDGVLNPIGTLPGGGASDPVTRLMVLANLPTYRASQPMEGRVQWNAGDKSETVASIRLGVYPTVHGSRAVIRMLRSDQNLDTVDSLGLEDDATKTLHDLTQATDGAILLTGPAGSGKTTSMYAMLRQIAGAVPRRSVLTIEDPVESVIDSISQSDLDPSGGMTLASALRSAVRQDSEVLLVSEIRDPETAEAALQASLTGHLVFSSLHASDVAAALRRLVQLGIPAYVIRSSVRAIVSQRLFRLRCVGTPADAAISSSKECTSDCPECGGIGYQGRKAVAQIVRFDGTDSVGEAMLAAAEINAALPRIRQAAIDAGGSSLRTKAEALVKANLTDEQEVFRVLGTQ